MDDDDAYGHAADDDVNVDNDGGAGDLFGCGADGEGQGGTVQSPSLLLPDFRGVFPTTDQYIDTFRPRALHVLASLPLLVRRTCCA